MNMAGPGHVPNSWCVTSLDAESYKAATHDTPI